MAIGEENVWETLAGLAPEEVCRRTDVTFDAASGRYALKIFGIEFFVAPLEREISSRSPQGDALLKKLGFFLRSSALGYLTVAKDIGLTGRLVSPLSMKSGQLFFRGAHELPLEQVAEKYGSNREAFLGKGRELGGTYLAHGDASFELFPLSGVPAVMILWLGDEEFPPRVDLLFDAASEIRFPIDAIWAIAMMCTLAVL
ncbi:MAG: DUF3786 domain-containing protein [Nitrospirota bacterium]